MKNPSLSRQEITQTLVIASIFIFRMLGLFMILPIFSAHALEGGYGANSAFAIGIAVGIYGLTQACLQIPFGMLSDRFGRKRMVMIGLIIFALGSILAGVAESLWMVVVGRALQGAGAVAAILLALLADITPPVKRLSAMAIIGSGIGFAFLLSLLLGPVLYAWVSVSGIFFFTALLALLGLLALSFLTEPANRITHLEHQVGAASLWLVLKNINILRLNVGVLLLHATLTGLFMAIPIVLQQRFELPLSSHWQVYMAVMLMSVVLMVPMILYAQRRPQSLGCFRGAILLLFVALSGMWYWQDAFLMLCLMLILFFAAFNFLEAALPTMVSQVSVPSNRGAAMGSFSSSQFIGAFLGGLLGGWWFGAWSATGVFLGFSSCVVVWLMISLQQKPMQGRPLIVALPEGGAFDEIEHVAQTTPGVLEAMAVPADQALYLKVKHGFQVTALEKRLKAI